MAYEVVMPQLGLSMDSGQIVEWLKKPGELIKPGDLLLVVESDKSAVEVEAVEHGHLHVLKNPADGPIKVGSVIAYLLEQGEQTPSIGHENAPDSIAGQTASFSPNAPQTPADADTNGLKPVAPESRRISSSPAARRRAKELGIDWKAAIPTGIRGQIKERDILELSKSSAISPQQPIQISPVARKFAESVGISIAELSRLQPGKRWEKADIEEVVRARLAAPALVSSHPVLSPTAPENPGHRAPAGTLRMLIADRMWQSSHNTAPVTLTTLADATELVKIRQALKDDPKTEVTPSYNILIVSLVAKALLEHPVLNATLDGNEIVYWETVNIGVAVNTERGLVVPVLRDVQAKPIRQLAIEGENLLKRAVEGKALPDELNGGTFTITNLGAYEIDGFTPIIKLPECAVLGIGRLVKQIVPVNDLPAVRTMVTLSLTFDHRLVDGAPAAAFLQRVKQFVELPYLWLI